MIRNYEVLSSSRDTWLKNDVGEFYGSPPTSKVTRTKWLFLLIVLLFGFSIPNAFSQVSYTQNFDGGAAGWTGDNFASSTAACGGSGQTMIDNIYASSSTGSFISPNLGNSAGNLVTISFDFKVANWSANNVGTAGNWGNTQVQYGSTAAGPWTTVATINQSNHTASGSCVNKLYTFTPPAGPLYIRFFTTWAGGDYYVNYDNVMIQEQTFTPPFCASNYSPADASTGIQRNPILTWDAAGGVPTGYDVYFGTSPTPGLVASVGMTTTNYTPSGPLLPSTTYYWQIIPTNANGPAVGCTVNSFTTGADVVYCVPVTVNGCTDGDVIARVILNTLDNNSGTGCPSGTLGYSDYTTDPALTTILQAGSNYVATVYAGQWSEGYAAWIDYDDDGFFEPSERIGYSNGQVAGSGSVGVLGSSASFPIALACNPPLGEHRMRVRAMYNTDGINVTPCGDNFYGEIEDYVVTITAPAACPQPSGLAAANVTGTSANLSWNIGCAETAWEISVQPFGAGVPTSGVAVSGTPAYTAEDFGSGGWEFYVRANCGVDGFSSWTGPFVFITPPSCATNFSPANAATNVGRNVDLTWSNGPTPPAVASYDVYFGTTSPPPFVQNQTTTTFETGLMDANTTYYWQIVPKTSTGIEAFSCVINSFTTGSTVAYCVPSTSSGCTDGDVIARVILNTLDNNSGTGCPSGSLGYSDYTTDPLLTTTLQAGSSYNATVYAGEWTEGYAAWIDYNDDGVFDESERIGYSIGQVPGSGEDGVLGSSATFPIVVSCNPPVGPHRLRVRAMFATNGDSVTPCGSNSYGETEDYTITISAPPACPQPFGLAANSVTSTSANLTWNAGCEETAWEVVVQPMGSGTPSGSGIAAVSPYEATDLTAGVQYEFYVRANCEANGFSAWTGPYMFSAPTCTTIVSPADGATNVPVGATATVPLTWTPSAGATTYQLWLGNAPGALTNRGNFAGPTVNLTEVNYGATYYWRIVPVNANGAATDCPDWSFTMEAAPADDVCSGATSLDSLTSPITDTNAGYNNDINPTCGSAGFDRFYSITVPPGYTLEIGNTASTYDSVTHVFYGSCASPTAIGCNDTELVEYVWENETGTTQTVYFVQDGWSFSLGNYTLAWSLTAPDIVINSFTPQEVCSDDVDGTVVTLSGLYFSDVTNVTVNGVSTPFNVVSDTTLEVTMTANTTTGVIAVESAVSSGSSATDFTVINNPAVNPITGQINTLMCAGGPTTNLDNTSPGGTWASSDESVATVDGNGIVTPVGGGTAEITYSVTDNGCTTTVSTTVTVNAPIVSTNPASQTVVTGTDSGFSVNATGDIAGYQWMMSPDGNTFSPVSNDSTFSGATTSELTITATPDTLNEYFFAVLITGTSPCSNFMSAPAMLTVGNVGIITHPSSQTLCSTGSGEVQLTVVASGEVDSYSWQVDAGFGFFEEITDGAYENVVFSGATTDQLTVTGLDLINSGWQFIAVVQGPANPATSNAATIIVNEGAVISADPVDTTSCTSGGTATFTVNASGGVAGFQWQYSTSEAGPFANVVNNTPIGATYAVETVGSASTLSVTTTASTPAAGTYFYRAIALAGAACVDAQSESAQLSLIAPVITQQPVATSTSLGSSATFTVVSSTPGATYQWQYATNAGGPWANVADSTPAGITYTGNTSASLSVNVSSTAATSSQRYYRAVLTSDGCIVNSSAAQLTIFEYCPANYTSGSGFGDEITNVTLGTMSNSSGASTTPYYTFFTGITIPDIQQLSTASVSITFGSHSTQYSAVWIDFNRNGQFETTEGVLASAPAGSYGTTVINIPVPVNAVPGQTRMRVRGGDDSALLLTSACGNRTYGETEDYIVNITPAPTCEGMPEGGTVTASVPNICVSGTTTLTVTGYTSGVQGVQFQWHNSSGPIAGANESSYTTPVLSSPESYFVRVTCSTSGLTDDSNTINIGINNPSVEATTPASRCGTGTVSLAATGSAGASLEWYAASTGGVPLYTGTNFTTPSISSTTTYYVAARIGGGIGNAGKPTSTGIDGSFIGTNYGIVFDAINDFTLNTAVIYPTGTGTITVALYNSSGTEIVATPAIPVSGSGLSTPVTIPIGFAVTQGTGYRLLVKSYTGLTGMIRDFSGPFPFNSTNMSVTAGYNGVPTTGAYYFFYNMTVSTGCLSARTAVTATVTPPPALTLSGSSTAVCAGSSTTTPVTITSNVADYDTYVWSPSTGVSGDPANGYTFNPASTTVYTLTAANANCGNTATYTVTVNPVPPAVAVTPASPTICSNGAAVQLRSGAPASLTGACLTAPNGNYPSGTFTGTCNGTVNTVTTAGWAGEYSNVAVAANTRYVFTSSGAGDYVTISNAAGTTALAAGPSPLTWDSSTAQTVRFYSHTNASCGSAQISRTRSFVCSPIPGAVWTPQTGLYLNASATVPYAGTSVSTVYAKPGTTTTYTATVTSGGCSSSGTATVTVTQAVAFYADTDGDGYGNAASSVMACTAPAGYVADNTDCDDTVATTNPGAQEIGYNLIDDDCDGSIDEGFPPKVTNVATATCGTTLASIDQMIYAGLVAGAQGYQWRITTVAGPNVGQIQLLDTPLRQMKMTQLVNYSFDATYQVEVAVYYGAGSWLQPYPVSSCMISTPSATTQLANCGQTLSNMNDIIHANMVPFATGYRFRITDPLNPSNTQMIDRPIRDFKMNMVTAFVIQYNKTYSVDVAVRNTDGTYLPYGALCEVTTPLFPTTGLQDSQCDDGLGGAYAPASMNTPIYAVSYPGAIAYVFRLTGGGLPVNGIEVTKPLRTFKLSDFAGMGIVPGMTYSVNVRLIFNESDGPGPVGKTCAITVPGGVRVKAVDFNAVAYPNPFAENFHIDLTTSVNDKVGIKVYDMAGRLLEERTATVSETEALGLGDRYPAGVYNVIVTQGEEVKTLRVIKR